MAPAHTHTRPYCGAMALHDLEPADTDYDDDLTGLFGGGQYQSRDNRKSMWATLILLSRKRLGAAVMEGCSSRGGYGSEGHCVGAEQMEASVRCME